MGHISLHPKGYGFLSVAEGGKGDSTFLPPPLLNQHLHGDRVRAQVVRQRDGRYKADKLELLERKRDRLFGTVVLHRGKPHLKTDRKVSNTDWPLRGADQLEVGTSVTAQLEGSTAVVEEEVPATVAHLERLYSRYGIRPRFPKAVEAELEQLPELDLNGRRDLRELPTLTIDADSSMDLDDALTALPAAPDGAIRVYVHIADVDSMVKEGSALDVEARARGTSVYLEGSVIPMLPRALSEDRLSLLPGRERPALTVELRIDTEGETRSVDVYPSLIRSDRRFSYDTVAAFLEKGEEQGIELPMKANLRWLRAAAARIAVVRAGRGGIEIEREDASIVMDHSTQEPTSVVARKEDSAHLLIERMMVAANEAVASWLVDRGLPGVFRVHATP
ncbi:MAG: RNB domain-containing ribonuclease, partial [Myxococcota bacterium]